MNTLEERTTTITIGDRSLVAEVRQYEPGESVVVWVPELSRTLTLTDTRDASESGKFVNEEEDASLHFTYRTWKESDTFVRIEKSKRTKTN
jgi:hypothetical protein